jgi:phosphate transport system permease protein
MKKKYLIHSIIILQSLIAAYLIVNILFNFSDFFQVSRYNQNTIITFIILILFVEIIVFSAYIFKEKAVKKILIVCASSSAFIVILIVAFIASEGLPAFTETDPIDFITGTNFQIFYQSSFEEEQKIVTIVQKEEITENDTTVFNVTPAYNLIHIPKDEAARFSTEYIFSNPVDEEILVTITVESKDYFHPSFVDTDWDYTTKTGQFVLNENETKTFRFKPRMTMLVEGTHFINISVQFTEDIEETVVLELRYQQNDMLRIDELSKIVEPNKKATYPFVFNGDTNRNYTIEINDIKPGWNYELKVENKTILTQSNPKYQFTPWNRTNDFTLTVTSPPTAKIGDFDQIDIIISDPGTKPTFGILPFIVGTFITSLIAILIAAPIGLGSAVILSEYTPSKIRSILRSLFELLAGIPSVIYGLWGFLTFGPILGNTLWPFIADTFGRFLPFLSADTMMQKATFTAGIVLSIMILPIIISLSLDAIRSVPRNLREGSLALGATRWQTIRNIILPCAKSGVVSGIILGLGRAIGETMAVLMIMQYVSRMPTSLLGPSGTMTGVIATMLGSMFSFDLARHALFGIALILFIIIFVLNIIIFFITKEKKYTDKKPIFSKVKAKIANMLIVLLVLPRNKKNKQKFSIIKEPKKRFTIIDNNIKNNPQDIKKVYPSKTKTFQVFSQKDNSQNNQIKHFTSVNIKPRIQSHYRIHPKKMEKIMVALLSTGAAFALGMLIWILGDILIKGIPSLQLHFFLEREIGRGIEGGFLNAIIGSLQLVGLALLISAPLAIGAAIYVQEYAKHNNPFTRAILFTSDTLASTPSIVFGGFGFLFFVVYLNFGYSVLAGGFTLAFMILPILLRTSIEAIKAIPREFYEGSLALGATKWQAIKTVILPPARPGIISGVILGIGRSIGETAAVMLTAGYSAHIATSILHPAASLPNMIYKYYNLSAQSTVIQDKVYSVSIVLILMVLILNTIFKLSYMKINKLDEA